MMTEETRQHWALDKRVPLALIITIIFQTFGFAYFMGQLANRVENLEARVAELSPNGNRLTRVETQLTAIGNTLNRLERTLDKLTD